MYWIILLTGITATIFFLFIRIKKGGLPSALAKSIPSFLFILTACISVSINTDSTLYGLLIIPGLVCGLLGDIWLDLKYVYPQDADTYLYAGFYSFLFGHIFFNIAIYSCFDWTIATLLISICLALAGSLILIIAEKPLGFDFGRFRRICFFYGFSLMMTTFSAVIASYQTGEIAFFFMAAGGILFLLSDLVLSWTYFSEGKTTPPYIIVNHAFYYAAQFIIASSILFMK